MLQTVCTSPELLVNQNTSENEISVYSPAQGSPLPGETASPKSYCQQSPALPDSGLTEFNVASPKIHPSPSHKPQEMSAPTDSGLSSGPPQKCYMGVRVKMPVRELLRKIRLSKGLDPAHSKETSLMKMETKGSSRKTAKRRVHPYTEKQLRQSKQSVGQTLKGLEDLDILVEVLQEDLNKSQLKKESLHSVPDGFCQGFSADLQTSWWESGGSKQAAGGPQERHHTLTKLHSYCCLRDSNSVLQGEVETSFHNSQKNMRESNSAGICSRTSEKESAWWVQDPCTSTHGDFPRHSAQDTSPHINPSGGCSEVLLEAHTGSPDFEGYLKSTQISLTQQDLSAISFFQFQLHREESLLRNIPADKLLAPDENGNRLLHKAVAQGRRALTYALAQRFASLNKIDEKDAEKRVFKNCKTNGICVEVNLTDHYGLTPLHCAALAHTVLATESQKTDIDTDMGRFLRLRKDQILEGINCLLQMGGKPELQVLNSRHINTTCLKIEENRELMCLLQTHKPKTHKQNILQESYNWLDAPRKTPSPSSSDNFSEPLSMSSSDHFDITLKASLVTMGNYNLKMMRTVQVEFTAKEENRNCLFVQQVCTVPRDYQGYDKVLGLCICQTDSLESVCNSQCRRQQRDTLQVTCTGKAAQLFITYRNGSKTAVSLGELRTVLLRPYFSLKDICTSEQGKDTHPTYIVEMSGKGFLGVYNPDPQLLYSFIMLNEASSHHENKAPSATAPVKSDHGERGSSWVQSLSPSNSTSKLMVTGILNPTACINVNVTIMFIVSKEHYPVYDVNNLYNTNAEFDWGDFRSLREEVNQASQKLLFFFQFRYAGTYVLRLGSNPHKKMYVRVMPLGGQCYEEGPFFPTTPRYAVQVGIAKKPDLLLKPDWTAIAGVITGLLALLIASVLLTLLCQGPRWSQRGTTCPPFRRQQLKYNLDSYCSEVSTVFSIKKRHPLLQNKRSMDGDTEGTARFLQKGDIWEPEEQIDLESFNTNVFFELLLRQSLSVTTKLGHFKDEVKTMYQELTREISSMKGLWMKTLSIPDETGACETYLNPKEQVELSSATIAHGKTKEILSSLFS
ncbi:hypothetical protein Q9966_009150 [Columba livia]|nr:hypothetical protein Q9966_009150 [Columba livia]